MSTVLTGYFAFGIGFYLAFTMCNIKSFMDASAADILRGILVGLVLWPIGLIVQVYLMMESE